MRAQIQQIFIYIMTIVVIGFILLLGVKYFYKIRETSCDAQKIRFAQDLTNLLDENSVGGRSSKEQIRRPCDFEVICFVDTNSIINKNPLTDFSDQGSFDLSSYQQYDSAKTIIANSVSEGIENNVFLIKPNRVEPITFHDMLILEDPSDPAYVIPDFSLCIPARSGYFNFTLIGKGKYVLVNP